MPRQVVPGCGAQAHPGAVGRPTWRIYDLERLWTGTPHRRRLRAAGRLQPARARRSVARSNRAADPRAAASHLHRDRRAQSRHAAALRGQGAGRRSQRGHRPDRRPGLRRADRVRRPSPDADARPAGTGRPALQQLPHHGAVLADPCGTQVGAQPSHGEHGIHHGDGHRHAGLDWPDPELDGAAGRDAAAQRLQHGSFRQVARDRGLGSERLRPLRSLADPPGLRQVLRVHRRRDEPVGAVPLQRHGRRRVARRPRLPLHDGHDQPGRGLDQVPEGPHAAETGLRLLRAGRHPRPASRAEGVDRPMEGQVRPGLGQAARGIAGPADRAGRRAAGHEARAEAAGDQGLGRALRRREAPVRSPGRGLRRVRRIHRPRGRPHARGVRGRRRGRQHAGLLHRGRQRHERRRRTERPVQ